MDIIDKITASQMKKDLPEFRVGDSVIVGCIITETKGGKSKERVQDFKGVVIARKGPVGVGKAEAYVDGKLAVSAELTFAIE